MPLLLLHKYDIIRECNSWFCKEFVLPLMEKEQVWSDTMAHIKPFAALRLYTELVSPSQKYPMM